MTEEEQVNAALLEDVRGFLADPNVPSSPLSPPRSAETVSGDDSLLFTAHQLLAETETLLSSFHSSTVIDHGQEQLSPKTALNTSDISSKVSKNDLKTTKTSQLSADERRELRNAQATKRRLRYRQKLKDEKETLKREEVKLSSELKRLQKTQVDEKMCQVDKMALSVWKAIATRQKEKRNEAEQTQRQLRAAVIGRARMMHQMSALLQPPERPKLDNGDVDAKRDGTVLFKSFEGELDAVYAQTDQVMQDADFKMSSTLQYKPKRTMKQGVEVFDSADTTLIPFSFQETGRAISLLMLMDPDNCSTEVDDEPRYTAKVKYEVKCQLEPGEISKLQVYSVVRKYEEPDRVVFVWRALTEGCGDLSGYHSDETGWLVLRPTGSVNCNATRLESYVRFVPLRVGKVSSGKVDPDRFAKIVAKSGEEEVNEMGRMLEKMLLQETQCSQSCLPYTYQRL